MSKKTIEERIADRIETKRVNARADLMLQQDSEYQEAQRSNRISRILQGLEDKKATRQQRLQESLDDALARTRMVQASNSIPTPQPKAQPMDGKDMLTLLKSLPRDALLAALSVPEVEPETIETDEYESIN